MHTLTRASSIFDRRDWSGQSESEASRAAMAEWYIASWKLELSLVFLRSCFAFSSVKPPSANLDLGGHAAAAAFFWASGSGISGWLSPSGRMVAVAVAVAAAWLGSEGHPKSGAHQFAEPGFGRFRSGIRDEGGGSDARIARAGLKDGSAADIGDAMALSNGSHIVPRPDASNRGWNSRRFPSPFGGIAHLANFPITVRSVDIRSRITSSREISDIPC
ncbi:hypothetical protein NL676_026807 [Syzygium grande]|nr:hypothetical protein NL676_026807 [Syzygium grande]